MPEENLNYEATSIKRESNSFAGGDVDDLIRQTIEETKATHQAKQPTEVKTESIPVNLSATHINIEKPKIEKPKEIFDIQKSESSAYEKTFQTYKVGDIVKGKVVKVDSSGVLVDIKYKSDGFIPPEDLSGKSVKVGDDIDVYIENLETKEGYVKLSKKIADYEGQWKSAFDAYRNKKVLEAKVMSAVKGGLVVDYNGIRGFIPASQIAKESHVPLEDFISKIIPIKIIQLDRRQGKVVLSHKLAASEKKSYESDKVIDDLEIGQVRHGKVSSLKKFGAFVDIGGIEGLIHLSELSWKRISHPSQILKVGEELDVFVLGVDKVNRKVALGLKELQSDPWVTANEKYKVGQIINVKIARFTKFGAFVDIDDELEGLIHITELSIKPISTAEEAVKIGDVVEAKILRIIPEEQKIGLSIKEALNDKEKQELKQYQASSSESRVTLGDIMRDKLNIPSDAAPQQ